MRHRSTLARLAALALLSHAVTAAVAEDVIASGTYVRARGTGSLRVGPAGGERVFSIETIGGNCHLCAIDGRLSGNVGVAALGEPNDREVCRVRFSTTATDTVNVQPMTEVTCRSWCGMRASFEGIYRKPTGVCTRAAQRAARARFLNAYRLKHFPEAIQTLEPVLNSCREFIDWIELDRMRNDLALAYLHTANPQQCLQILEPTVAAGYVDEESLTLPPCDFDNYLPTARATWRNQRICRAASAGH